MKGRMLLRRTPTRASNRRASSSGYSLIELMVVVLMIAVLAMLAAPSLVRGRSDRLAFSYARTVQELIHNSRSRAAGRGAAQLVAFSTADFGARGAVFTFEALDRVAPGGKMPGPGPSPSCRTTPKQWDWVKGWGVTSPADPANSARLIDGLTINPSGTADVVVQENIKMAAARPDPGGGAATSITAFVICVTPNGTTYYGEGGTVSAAVDAMMASGPFEGTVEIDVARHDAGNNIVGLNRRVIVTGAAAPRIKSE